MIIVLNKQIEPGDKERIVDYLKEKGFRIREIQGESDTVLGAVGSAAVDHNEIRVLPGVAEVRHRRPHRGRKRRRDFAGRRLQTPNLPVCVSGTR